MPHDLMTPDEWREFCAEMHADPAVVALIDDFEVYMAEKDCDGDGRT